MNQASLYIHFPFCIRKCFYCDFYSVESLRSLEQFLQALKHEIVLRRALLTDDVVFETIYFGGGTPSLISAEQLAELLGTLSSSFEFSDDVEITIEVNPGTVSLDWFSRARLIGVNRVSIGIQSFDDQLLQWLTRIHSSADGVHTYLDARDAGFENVSIDLMFGLPIQSIAQWECTLQRAVELGPEHISTYSLIVEPETQLERLVQAGRVKLLDDDADAAMYQLAIELLTSSGYEQYEISNFAKPGFRSRHNANYWNHKPYLGLGPSAHSFWKGERSWNVRSISEYICALNKNRLPTSGAEILRETEQFEESIYLGLRQGRIDMKALASQFGIDLAAQKRDLLEEWERLGFIFSDGAVLQLTRRGFLIADELARQLI
ncbi:MAG: radical SAM family heme chaperone HemW [Bacteroidota bacterium]